MLSIARVGAHKGILITMWDTDSAANRRHRVPGDSAVNASSVAPIDSGIAISSLPTMGSILAGHSMKTAAATPLVSDISLVSPVTGVPNLTNSRSMGSAPVEAA